MHALLEEISKSAASDTTVNAILDAGVDELVDAGINRRRACKALGCARAGALPAPPPTTARPTPTATPLAAGPCSRPRPPRSSTTLNSERFCDQAPAQIWATLLDEGTYLARCRPCTGYSEPSTRSANDEPKPADPRRSSPS